MPQGVLAILASVMGMALADALIKKSAGDMTLWQLWVLRSGLVLGNRVTARHWLAIGTGFAGQRLSG